jgi:hypothetical protein
VGAFDVAGPFADISQPGGRYGAEWKPLALAPVNVYAKPLDSPHRGGLGGGSYRRYAGTSCASPVLAGAGALYLQRHPRATVRQFAAAVKRAARGDMHTGDVPSAKCGYGKIDFFDLVTKEK